MLGNVQQRAKLLRLAVDQHRQYTNEARNPGVSYYNRQGLGGGGGGIGVGGGGCWEMSSRERSCYDWQWISTDNILTRQEILEFLITVGRVQGKGGGGV